MAKQSSSRIQIEGAYQELLAGHVAQLSSQQQLLYASNRHAVLLIFQAMDAPEKMARSDM